MMMIITSNYVTLSITRCTNNNSLPRRERYLGGSAAITNPPTTAQWVLFATLYYYTSSSSSFKTSSTSSSSSGIGGWLVDCAFKEVCGAPPSHLHKNSYRLFDGDGVADDDGGKSAPNNWRTLKANIQNGERQGADKEGWATNILQIDDAQYNIHI